MLKKFNPKKTKQLHFVNKCFSLFYHEKKSGLPVTFSKISRILIIDFTAIGDMVMLLPFLRVLKREAANASVTLVCGSWGKDILEEQGLVDEFIIMDGKLLESPQSMIKNRKQIETVLAGVNVKEYDLALEPRGDLRYIFFMHYCSAKRKISYNYTGGEGLLTDVIRPSDNISHLIEDKMYFLRALGCSYNEEDLYPYLNRMDHQQEYTEKFKENYALKNKTVVGVHPGARLKVKQWTKYGELLKKISERYDDLAFLVFEGPGEKEVVDRVISIGKTGKAYMIRSRTDMKQYMQRISLCDLMICNDSGAGHIAGAYGVKTFVIFGPVQPQLAKPYGRKIHVLSKEEISCKPCFSTTCSRNGECLNSITVDMVYNEIVKYWNE